MRSGVSKSTIRKGVWIQPKLSESQVAKVFPMLACLCSSWENETWPQEEGP